MQPSYFYSQEEVLDRLNKLLAEGKLVYLGDKDHFYNAYAILGSEVHDYWPVRFFSNSTGLETIYATGPRNIVPEIINSNYTI